jgi:hypothetical protein
VRAQDLAEVALAEGPFATVYLATEPGVDNAGVRSLTRWKGLRRALEEAGAPEKLLEQMEPEVSQAHRLGASLALIGDGTDLRHIEHGPELPPAGRSWWAPLPRLGPIIEWRQSAVPHVVVLADRVGADLHAVGSAGLDITTAAGGDDYPIHKSGAGGWSQRRYQERVENTWEQNAEEVAAMIVRLADAVEAEAIFVSGDVRALQLIRDELPAALRERLEEIPGGRSEDGSSHHVAAEIRTRLDVVVARDTMGLVERFREELGQQDRAADGPGATLAALQRAQVDSLLVVDDPDDERTAWFGPEAAHASVNRGDLEALGVAQPTEDRLVDVAIRAALGTGAGVRLVPREAAPADGIGAILRWST